MTNNNTSKVLSSITPEQKKLFELINNGTLEDIKNHFINHPNLSVYDCIEFKYDESRRYKAQVDGNTYSINRSNAVGGGIGLGIGYMGLGQIISGYLGFIGGFIIPGIPIVADVYLNSSRITSEAFNFITEGKNLKPRETVAYSALGSAVLKGDKNILRYLIDKLANEEKYSKVPKNRYLYPYLQRMHAFKLAEKQKKVTRKEFDKFINNRLIKASSNSNKIMEFLRSEISPDEIYNIMHQELNDSNASSTNIQGFAAINPYISKNFRVTDSVNSSIVNKKDGTVLSAFNYCKAKAYDCCRRKKPAQSELRLNREIDSRSRSRIS